MFKKLASSLMFAVILCVCELGLQTAAATETNLEVVLEFNAALKESPESITMDAQGNLYWSMSANVWKLSSRGEISVFGTLPIPVFTLGIKMGPDNCIYAVSTSLSDIEGAFVWKLCDGQGATAFAELDHLGGLNDLVFDKAGNIYVTDPILGIIWKVDQFGNTQVWLDDELLKGNGDAPELIFTALGADGIVLDKAQKNLYVGNLDYGKILKISINEDGSAGEISEFVSNASLEGADGMLFDKHGNLMVAVNSQNTVVSITPCAKIDVIASDQLLDGPSSLTFGVGKESETLYICNGAFGRQYGYISGTAHPTILKMRMKNKHHRHAH